MQVLDLMGNAFTDVKNAGDNVRFTLTDYPVYVVGAKIGID